MSSEFEENRQEFLAERRKTRLQWVDFWANFVRTHPDKEWSRQQKTLIDSQIQSARSVKMDPSVFLHMKGEKIAPKKGQ